MNSSKAKKRAMTLLEQTRGQLQEALREVELVDDPNMVVDDAHRFIRRALEATEQALVSLDRSLF